MRVAIVIGGGTAVLLMKEMWIAAFEKNATTGKVAFPALPTDEAATQFFMKVKMVS